MLYFTRWKALAIILTALVVCLCAVPNFFPEATVKAWPKWAQRHLVLGLDLQGGSHILLEVDSNSVKKDKLDQVRDDVRRTLRDNKIVYTGLGVRNDNVEVRITKDTDQATALTKLRELSQPLGGLLGSSGQRSLEVGEDLVPGGDIGSERDQVVVVEGDAPGAELAELLHGLDRIQRGAGCAAELIRAGPGHGPQAEGEFVGGGWSDGGGDGHDCDSLVGGDAEPWPSPL